MNDYFGAVKKFWRCQKIILERKIAVLIRPFEASEIFVAGRTSTIVK